MSLITTLQKLPTTQEKLDGIIEATKISTERLQTSAGYDQDRIGNILMRASELGKRALASGICPSVQLYSMNPAFGYKKQELDEIRGWGIALNKLKPVSARECDLGLMCLLGTDACIYFAKTMDNNTDSLAYGETRTFGSVSTPNTTEHILTIGNSDFGMNSSLKLQIDTPAEDLIVNVADIEKGLEELSIVIR